ncbi:Phage protein (plasmid) [Euzebya pacifica]|uniref:Phage protein n=1 Tax=Euzebya pacifica TaxID=1608957 RepID=A0A346Y631_9ACTN|nr:hypothetical protein [Euzebya pacifica]AXV09928.1 Phage protein [Euzebya pacifica]
MTLPPTQHLLLDLLAARARLGEAVWTVPNTCRQAIDALAADGLVKHKSAPVAGHQLVWLTEAGRAEVMSDGYVPPRDRPTWVADTDGAITGPFHDQHDADIHAARHGGTVRQIHPPEPLDPQPKKS